MSSTQGTIYVQEGESRDSVELVVQEEDGVQVFCLTPAAATRLTMRLLALVKLEAEA